MFKLIAVKVLEGCRKSVCKCLSVGKMYYFNNDYYITDDSICLRDEYIRLLPDDFFSLDATSTLQINISAVVGMNGDGKSTLMELVMRLINNCAKHYRLADKDNLLQIVRVKAELYYLLDSVVYCIKEAKEDNYASLWKCADMSDSDVRQWNKIMTPVKSVSRMNELFYTIVSNYSHYAYNTRDFREEWSDKVQSEEDCKKCWLHYLFHKNDGYRTPITIHPYRYEGNIDVNREAELTMQRLVALYIQEANPKENNNSFRRIGSKDAELLQLTDIGYSKLQEFTIIQFFEDNKSISLLLNYIKKIEDNISAYDDFEVENLQDNMLETVECCLDLLTGTNDEPYSEFIRAFYVWIGNKKGVCSSKSDLRKFLNSMRKFNNSIKITRLPYNEFAKKYKRYDKLNVKQLIRIRFVYDVLNSWEFPVDILLKEYEDLNEIERCQHYIIYKTISICAIYPEYRDFVDSIERGWNNNGLVFNNSVIKEVVEKIKKDKTHVTLKLRQCLNFIELCKKENSNIFEKVSDIELYNKLGNELKGGMFIRFDDLKSYFKREPFPLDLLPPPIYKTDILFCSELDLDNYIPYKYLSSGEKQLLNNFGALIYHLRNLDSVTDDGRIYENVNVLFEEIELYFHPEYQRMIIKVLVEKLHALGLNHIRRINITFVTHSPFILSDIPLCNVLFLKDGKPVIRRIQENTFGANIHGLLKNGFFLPSLPMGEFAYDKINELFEKLNGYKLDPNNREHRDWFYSNIMRVGEPYLREQLMKLYNMHYSVYVQ
mgnify:FL=1